MPYTDSNKKPALATASLILGIVSLFPFFFGGTTVICGALGITFALLSRGALNLSKTAKTGLILSIIGTLLSIGIIIFTYYMIFSSGIFKALVDKAQTIDWSSGNATSDFYDYAQSLLAGRSGLSSLLGGH